MLLLGRTRSGRSWFQAQSRQKSSQDPISTEKDLGVVAHTCHPSNDRKPTIEELQTRLAWAKTENLSPNNQSKKVWKCGSSGGEPV
jgi:hypothetical protein